LKLVKLEMDKRKGEEQASVGVSADKYVSDRKSLEKRAGH
jgi:hypothetical protein